MKYHSVCYKCVHWEDECIIHEIYVHNDINTSIYRWAMVVTDWFPVQCSAASGGVPAVSERRAASS